MKKILCSLLIVCLIMSFSACKSKDDNATNTVGESVDQNTVSLVNDAYVTTADLLNNADSLGFKANYRKKFSYDNESGATGTSFVYNFVGKGEGSNYFYEIDSKTGGTDEHTMMYSDGKNVYGYKADTTYLITNDNSVVNHINDISKSVIMYNGSDFDVSDTIIMNTSSGGHAFMLTYDIESAEIDIANVFAPVYDEATKDYELKPISLIVSGIVDTKGRIVEETVSYVYSYEYEDMTTIDPDNAEAQGTMRTVTVTLEAELYYDYDLELITAPADITLLPEEGKSTEQTIKELSLTDFLKIGLQSTRNK